MKAVRSIVPSCDLLRIIEFHRQNYDKNCFYCGVPLNKTVGDMAQKTKDHVMPLGLGGRSSDDNLVSCCLACNQEKSGITIEVFRKQKGGFIFWAESEFYKFSR